FYHNPIAECFFVKQNIIWREARTHTFSIPDS
ncbi:hypothetical protein CP8484711_0290B, partial [Chlamydia psittaci 84-8471/1]